MKVAIVGGTGIAEMVLQKYSADNFSRSNGYDISIEKQRHEITHLSLNYDVFINHAYSGDASQFFLLYDLIKIWSKFDKEGHIINTGTILTHLTKYDEVNSNQPLKTAMDELCKSSFKKYQSNKVNFKTTNLKLGKLGNDGISKNDFFDIINYILSQSAHIHVGEIVIETKHDV